MAKQKIKVNVTTSIELQMWKLAKRKKISWSKALTKGIELLAKKGVKKFKTKENKKHPYKRSRK